MTEIRLSQEPRRQTVHTAGPKVNDSVNGAANESPLLAVELLRSRLSGKLAGQIAKKKNLIER